MLEIHEEIMSNDRLAEREEIAEEAARGRAGQATPGGPGAAKRPPPQRAVPAVKAEPEVEEEVMVDVPVTLPPYGEDDAKLQAQERINRQEYRKLLADEEAANLAEAAALTERLAEDRKKRERELALLAEAEKADEEAETPFGGHSGT